VLIAVAVLAGALLVGNSVRGSLRDLVHQRLGGTAQVLSSAAYFREGLAQELGNAAPVIGLHGVVAKEGADLRVPNVQVWGVDERFWRIHGVQPQELATREALASPALARDLQISPGDAIQLTVEQPSAIPLESVHGHKENTARVSRLTLKSVLAAGQMGEFSLRPQQGEVRALFVPLRRLQSDFDRPEQANFALLAEPVTNDRIRAMYRLDDVGVRLVPLEGDRGFAVESATMILSDPLARAVMPVASATGARAEPIYAYLANTIRIGAREVPYSLIAATDAAAVTGNGIALNEWAAQDLNASIGDHVHIEYFVWTPEGRLLTEAAEFRLERILPMSGMGADRDLAPRFPGISDAGNVSEWDPPFPLDLKRIRQRDEDYWDRFRTAPKAFVSLSRGQELWSTRYGSLTSIRIQGVPPEQFAELLREAINPEEAGLALADPLNTGIAASAGATDFGEYFTYFSFFIVMAALLLAGLFFRFSVEQRSREIGALQALGHGPKDVRRLFLTEGMIVAVIGAVLGVLGALGYAALIVYGLGSWWVDAVGTRLLTVHLAPLPLLYGALGGIVSAVLFLLLALRQIRRSSPRALLAGRVATVAHTARSQKRASYSGYVCGSLALLLLVCAVAGVVPQTAAFFGAGGLLLVASLAFLWRWLVRRPQRAIEGAAGLGIRYASYHPGRSILSIALIASAAFIIVAVDSFRRGEPATMERQSGTGGFPIMAQTVLPVYHDLNTPAGREALNMPQDLGDVDVYSFRVRPGDDASCLNLYRPQDPRIAAPARPFEGATRFAFADSLANTPEERANPWVLLERATEDGSIPAIADANSLSYVLHKSVGDVLEIPGGLRLKFVASLRDSVLQSEIIISQANFLAAFPREEGFRMFLVDAPPESLSGIIPVLEDTLLDHGGEAFSTAQRLAAYHRVENTYLSTFQALGSLGLLLGTAGLGAVLLRNVFERRREIALLRAVGYTPRNLRLVLVSENLLLLGAGLITGTICALIAISPAWMERGGSLPILSMASLLALILVTGLGASVLALRAVNLHSVLSALRED
jgi:putative ABC transport system permease protein